MFSFNYKKDQGFLSGISGLLKILILEDAKKNALKDPLLENYITFQHLNDDNYHIILYNYSKYMENNIIKEFDRINGKKSYDLYDLKTMQNIVYYASMKENSKYKIKMKMKNMEPYTVITKNNKRVL